MSEIDDTVAAVRRFNRFYTRAIGVLDRAYLGGPYTLAESRVLYEIANGEPVTPSAIAAPLNLDLGYLSRILAKLERDGMVVRERSPSDGRSVTLGLTQAGRDHFATLNARTVAKVQTMLEGLSGPGRAKLAGALDAARDLLEGEGYDAPVALRPHRPGDMGWVVERHAQVYGGEYGWGAAIEGVTARICADFLEHHDPARERCWIAERGGQRLGCIFLVKEPETADVARLRLLLLTPEARGLGLGRRLVEECLGFARAAGYRDVVLWTHAVLTAARAIYAQVGFQITETWTHDEFGKTEVSETWRLTL